MFHRKKAVRLRDDDDDAREALDRLTRLTDRLEETTHQLADLVALLRSEDQGVDHA